MTCPTPDYCSMNGCTANACTPQPMNTLDRDLRNVCEWLKILNRSGFPIIADIEDALYNGGNLRPVAQKCVDGTRHLAAPCLDNLRKHFT